MFRFVFAFAMLAPALATAAEPKLLDGAALREMVGGATVELDTPIGSKIPMRYTTDGRVSGEAPNLAFYLGSTSDRGTWWVSGDQLCQKWKTWFDAAAHCLELRQTGDTIHWRRDDGKTGTATVIRRDPPPVQIASMTLLSPQAAPAAAKTPEPTTPPPKSEASPAVAKPAKPKPAVAPPVPAAASAKVSMAPPVRIEPKPEMAPLPQRADQPTFRVSGVDEDDHLFVRRGPSSDYPAIGAIPPQARGVQITGQCQQEWCPILHRGTGGWVNSYYLSPEPLPHRRW